MQLISEIMTPDVATLGTNETIERAAQLMDELNVGSIPVVEGGRLVGMVTDRDIVVRAVSAGRAPGQTSVADVMSAGISYCFTDEVVDEVMQRMRDIQVRRMPVMDRATGRLAGIVALGDLATKHSAEVDRTLSEISTPSEPDRR
ncbi:MAG: CBS domain-containing protein [Burkholderiaceae bacterium]|jgi:CBS domain-containing protein